MRKGDKEMRIWSAILILAVVGSVFGGAVSAEDVSEDFIESVAIAHDQNNSISQNVLTQTGVSVPSTVKVRMNGGSVVTMDLDEYLKGVVAAEMYSTWPVEALKAQAVASRSFAIANAHHDHINEDVCTDHGCCQAWEAGSYSENVEKAVTETHNVVMTYNGEITKEALFFSHCNGNTRNSEDYCPGGSCWNYEPYLRSVSCDCGFGSYYGHGVGMCQYGAKAMAEQGYNCVDILKHYYSGVAITSGESTAKTLPVPYIHQCWDTSEDFDGRWACSATSAVMAVAYYGILDPWPCDCSQPYPHTNDYGNYISKRVFEKYQTPLKFVIMFNYGVYGTKIIPQRFERCRMAIH